MSDLLVLRHMVWLTLNHFEFSPDAPVKEVGIITAKSLCPVLSIILHDAMCTAEATLVRIQLISPGGSKDTLKTAYP
ncbi:hypothetical protein CK203_077647 [Vitis vinifera]|uniref:Uncharacterized protein n=1 Tax=Vitis vinifera TaxID=29760 RepID=A0A438ETY2_VITVI|nr:hypothetical protein CK203_077647 [Vitis vinifera]